MQCIARKLQSDIIDYDPLRRLYLPGARSARMATFSVGVIADASW